MFGLNSVLHALPEAVLAQIKSHLRPIRLTAGHAFFSAGDHIDSLYLINSGAVSLVTELSDGQTIESAMVGRGGLVGAGAVLDDREAIYKAVVQIEGDGLSLDMATARRLAQQHEQFRTALARHEQLVLAQAQQSAACNATHNLNQRLARWLLRVCDAVGADDFKLTQDLMAEMLGVGRTSVSIVAHGLQQGGLISYRRANIHIESRAGLERMACECYQTVKLRYESANLAAPRAAVE